MGIIKSYLRVSKEQIEDLNGVEDAAAIDKVLESSKERIDIDKSWEILHYLLLEKKTLANTLLRN